MGDGEAPIVGGGQPEVRATTSPLGDVPVGTEWAPAREPAAESSGPQPSLGVEHTIPTPVSTASIPTLLIHGFVRFVKLYCFITTVPLAFY